MTTILQSKCFQFIPGTVFACDPLRTGVIKQGQWTHSLNTQPQNWAKLTSTLKRCSSPDTAHKIQSEVCSHNTPAHVCSSLFRL